MIRLDTAPVIDLDSGRKHPVAFVTVDEPSTIQVERLMSGVVEVQVYRGTDPEMPGDPVVEHYITSISQGDPWRVASATPLAIAREQLAAALVDRVICRLRDDSKPFDHLWGRLADTTIENLRFSLCETVVDALNSSQDNEFLQAVKDIYR